MSINPNLRKTKRQLFKQKPHTPTPQELLEHKQITVTFDNKDMCKDFRGKAGIYIIYSYKGQPLYVGLSKKDLGRRVTSLFSKQKDYIEVGVEVFDDEWQAVTRERELVWELKPSLNKVRFKHQRSPLLLMKEPSNTAGLM